MSPDNALITNHSTNSRQLFRRRPPARTSAGEQKNTRKQTNKLEIKLE